MNYETFTESFAYYDRTAMQEYFEQKALEGWRLCKKEKFSNWVFERIEPKKLHYAITYLPQFSNEDSFLLSENKKEYLDFCAEQGWQFACVHKNMVIFYNEEEDPVPLETDPEVELAAIHKSMMKNIVAKSSIVFVSMVAVIAFLVMNFNNDPIKFFFNLGERFSILALFISIFITFNLTELVSYYHWRKKAVAAASLGSFTKTEFSTKLLTAFQVIITVMYVVFVLFVTIISGNDMGLWLIGISIILIFTVIITKNAEEKIQGKKRKVLIIGGALLLIAMVVAGYFVKYYYDDYDSSHIETYTFDSDYTGYVYKDDIPLKIEDMGLDVDPNQYSYELTDRKSAVVVITEASQSARMDVKNYYALPHLNYTVYEIKWQFLLERSFEIMLKDDWPYRTCRQIDETLWKAEKAYEKGIYYYLLCYDDKIVEIELSWEITPEQAAIVAEKLG